MVEDGTVSIEIANTEMAAAWDGHEGDVWTDQADRYDRAGRRVLARFLDEKPVNNGDAVLDVGCGTGNATRAVARLTLHGPVVGVDLSTRMLELARTKTEAEHLTNVTYARADAQVHPFEPEAFDVAVSSFGAMFFNDPVAAFTNIGRALRPDGRLALLAWRALPENRWLMSIRGALAIGRELPMPPPDAPTPFALADPDRVRLILGAAGFDEVGFTPVDEPMEIGVDASDALDFAKTMGIVEGLTEALSADDRATAMDNLRNLFVANETPDGVLLDSASWVITARRSSSIG